MNRRDFWDSNSAEGSGSMWVTGIDVTPRNTRDTSWPRGGIQIPTLRNISPNRIFDDIQSDYPSMYANDNRRRLHDYDDVFDYLDEEWKKEPYIDVTDQVHDIIKKAWEND